MIWVSSFFKIVSRAYNYFHRKCILSNNLVKIKFGLHRLAEAGQDNAYTHLFFNHPNTKYFEDKFKELVWLAVRFVLVNKLAV